ncbi:MgtC/SapB family protein [Chitinophagaceae bacterium MMS25-I14]
MEFTGILAKLFLAILIGGAIGVEREYRSKSAGFRTLIMICLGATLFTILSRFIASPTEVSRVASNVVVGIGFVGAGVIFKGDNRVNGITTAATIWVTAALGVGIGAGYYLIALAGCAVVVLVHSTFPYLERYIDRANRARNYKVVYPYPEYDQHSFEQIFRHYHLTPKSSLQSKNGIWITGSWLVYGNEKNHHKFIQHILKDEHIQIFEF